MSGDGGAGEKAVRTGLLDEPDLPEDELHLEEDDAEAMSERATGLFSDRRRLATLLLGFVAVVVAIYVVLPKVFGLDDALAQIGSATWYWIVVALGFNIVAFATYMALFRGVMSGSRPDEEHVRERLDLRATYQITLAGLAATRVFSAAGAGGLAVTYWALRRMGVATRRAACRMVAFLALQYVFYLLALIVFGILLRANVVPGDNPVGGTIVPAAIAGVVLAILVLVSFIPEDVERRMSALAERWPRFSRVGSRLAKGPATMAMGVRTAIGFIRHPGRGALAILGAVGFWAANIGVLWASFEAFGGDVPLAVLVQGFFVGMAANLVPSPAGGVGSVDAGMIAAFLLFGVSEEIVFPAVLTYRVIAFWLPIPPGVIAFFQLQKTAAAWREEDRRLGRYTSKSKVKTVEAT